MVCCAVNIVSILDEDEGGGDYTVNFLRKNVSGEKTFYWPKQSGTSAAHIEPMAMFLPVPVSVIDGNGVELQFHTNVLDCESRIQ